jgi:hypothetical protein
MPAFEMKVPPSGLATTSKVAVALRPSIVAVIVALPGAPAVASPEDVMVAISVSDELHVNERPDMRLPLWSRAIALNWSD